MYVAGKKKKSLKNDFENFPPENVTTVLCIDLEMSVKAMNSDYDEKIKKKEKSTLNCRTNWHH